MHYANYKECLEKWNSRKSRINFDKLLFLFTDQNGCSKNAIERFHRIKGKKILFLGSEDNLQGYDYEILVTANREEALNKENPIDHCMNFYGLSGKRRYERNFDLNQFIKNLAE